MSDISIDTWSAEESFDGTPGTVITLSTVAALKIAESLLHQINTKNPNSRRYEFLFVDNEAHYFSICVI